MVEQFMCKTEDLECWCAVLSIINMLQTLLASPAITCPPAKLLGSEQTRAFERNLEGTLSEHQSDPAVRHRADGTCCNQPRRVKPDGLACAQYPNLSR